MKNITLKDIFKSKTTERHEAYLYNFIHHTVRNVTCEVKIYCSTHKIYLVNIYESIYGVDANIDGIRTRNLSQRAITMNENEILFLNKKDLVNQLKLSLTNLKANMRTVENNIERYK